MTVPSESEYKFFPLNFLEERRHPEHSHIDQNRQEKDLYHSRVGNNVNLHDDQSGSVDAKRASNFFQVKIFRGKVE